MEVFTKIKISPEVYLDFRLQTSPGALFISCICIPFNGRIYCHYYFDTFFKFSVVVCTVFLLSAVDLCQQKPTIKNIYTLLLLLILFLSGAVQLEQRTAALKSCQRKQFALQFFLGFIFQLSFRSLFSLYLVWLFLLSTSGKRIQNIKLNKNRYIYVFFFCVYIRSDQDTQKVVRSAATRLSPASVQLPTGSLLSDLAYRL